MFNVFAIKKWAALTLVGVISTITFAIASIFYGILWGTAGFLVGLLVSVLLGNLFLKNPFTNMLEGKGLLCLDINSSGIIKPFLVQFNAPYIQGKVNGKKMQDIFNRDTIGQLSTPIEDAGTAEWKDGKLTIVLDNEKYTKSKMVMLHYPVIIWNSIINSLMTKEQLSELEKDTFSEHIILYMNRKLDELTSLVRDFGRYIVELTKPKSMLGNKWIWIVLVVGAVILIALFAPAIIEQISNTGASAVESISGNAIVTPK